MPWNARVKSPGCFAGCGVADIAGIAARVGGGAGGGVVGCTDGALRGSGGFGAPNISVNEPLFFCAVGGAGGVDATGGGAVGAAVGGEATGRGGVT